MGFHLLYPFVNSSGAVFKSPYQCSIPIPWILPLALYSRCEHEEYPLSQFLILFLKRAPRSFEIKALHGNH